MLSSSETEVTQSASVASVVVALFLKGSRCNKVVVRRDDPVIYSLAIILFRVFFFRHTIIILDGV